MWRLTLGAAAMVCAGCGARSLSFEKHTLDTEFRAEGVAVADVDGDGHPDIVTDQLWYAGPQFVPHEIRTPETYDPATQYSHGFAVYATDVDGDARPDLIVADLPGTPMGWYHNPGADVHWDYHVIAPAGVAGVETPIVVDLFGDGRRVLLMTDAEQQVLGWYEPPDDPTQPWPLHPISAAGFADARVFVHGIGAADLDGDGRLDVLTGTGWFQQTDDRAAWIWHPAPFGPNRCSDLRAFDLDRDGRADVFCATPHDYGLAWLHQDPPGADGEPGFTRHDIDDTISQMHALDAADLDGDGTPELISGKRFWAHGPSEDAGSGDPAVLAVFRLVGPSTFARLDVDLDSGIGTQFTVADADGDGRLDIVVSNKKGLHWFRQR